MIPISVCIIGKNEEKNIEKCLEPLTHYPFEIIFVDTGSTDRTKELAAKYTNKIYDFEWIGDFSAARNFSLSKASHNYVLVLDCDEFVLELDLEGICAAIEAHPRGVGRIMRNSYIGSDGQREKVSYEWTNRLFHKRRYHYIYLIHEQIAEIQTDNLDYECYNIPLTAEHVGYIGTIDEKRAKVERYNALLFKEIERAPTEPYFYFQVAQSYNLISDYENAYTYYKKAFNLPLNMENIWVYVMANNFINACVQTGRAAEALSLYTTVYNNYAADQGFLCSMGSLYLNQNPPQPLKAIMEYLKALQSTFSSEGRDYRSLAFYGIGFSNELLGNFPAAISFYQKSAAEGSSMAVDKLKELGLN